MAQEMELSDNIYTNELQGTEKSSERRLFRIGVVTLAVLCLIQASLNISLRLALYIKEDSDQLPFNSSTIADMCQIPPSKQDECSCCNKLLRRLLREYEAMEKERDLLKVIVSYLSKNRVTDEDYTHSGSVSVDEFLNLERN
ncbi:Hypothetical protein SMAX5B_014103 [Scophthalmus maximus]|uniref:Uncharacterized protein n=1 Tax=Scophthalmus maximus TaxID=52904 RepID=A0A2U9BHC6_SCOMX|nr:Hypothetical protein SMAX5B_014103 [Scophthalmus maximus]